MFIKLKYFTGEEVYVLFENDGYKKYATNDVMEINGKYYPKNDNFKYVSAFHNIRFNRKDIIFDCKKSMLYWINYVVETEKYNEDYYVLSISNKIENSTRYFLSDFLIKKEDIKLVEEFFYNRNTQRNNELSSVKDYVDNETLSMARNILDSIDDNTFLNFKCLTHCSLYSGSVTKRENYLKYFFTVSDGEGLKGNEKKSTIAKSQAEARSLRLFLELFVEFAEMLVEKHNISIYFAKAIAWEAIKTILIKKYSLIWEREYEGFLSHNFEEISCDSNNNEHALKSYIETVIECPSINFEEINIILMYFLFSKENDLSQNIGQYFIDCNILFEEVKKQVKKQENRNIILNNKKKTKRKYTIDDIDLMTGSEFEEFIELMFQKLGYTTQLTPKSRDQGIDVIAKRNSVKIGIQAKCYSSSVGNSAIQEVVAGGNYYLCNKMIVVTNNYFTTSAVELASSNNVVLWDREFLKIKLQEIF